MIHKIQHFSRWTAFLMPVFLMSGFLFASGNADVPAFLYENDRICVSGENCEKAVLENGGLAYRNRKYVWENVPKELLGVFFTKFGGGERGNVSVTAKQDTVILAASSASREEMDDTWTLRKERVFQYTDSGKTGMHIYSRMLKKGETVELPQFSWSGSQLLFSDQPIAWDPPLPPEPKLVRMKYRNPGLIDDLAVGLWVWIVPTDFNGDGKMDLILSCEDTPYNGTYRFENPGIPEGKTGLGVRPKETEPVPHAAMPVFRPGERISSGKINVQASFINGETRVLCQNQEFPDFANTGLRNPETLPLPTNIHHRGLRGNMWKYVDFDGDGNLDIAVGIDDWKDYGWDNAWDENGNWKNKPTLGAVYIIRNGGTNDAPQYEKPHLLADTNGNTALTYGWPSPSFEDFDGDGDLDLLCGEFRDKFTYFENIGMRTQPAYAPGVRPATEDGSPAAIDLCMATPVVFDWTQDGKPDILCGDEDGRVALFENTGNFRTETKDGKCLRVPIFKAPLYFQQEADELKAGALVTPCGADLNGDGADDLLCGTSAGYIMFFENLSEPGEEFPTWAKPVFVKAGGKIAHINAKPNGSIQGPIEEKWGYTTLTAADWDGDGLTDIMWNHIWGKPAWFKNIGTKTKPEFSAPQPVEVEWEGPQPELAWGWLKPEGKKLLTQWRTTPVMFDVNADGLMDLCMLDTEGYFAFFERFRDADGTLKLMSPQRIFFWEDGTPMRLNSGFAGGSGRRKIAVCDWDGDGNFDLLLNSRNADLARQVKKEDGKFYFRNQGTLDGRKLAGHSSSPTTADFNADGIPDLVVGAEDGRLYYLRNPRSDEK